MNDKKLEEIAKAMTTSPEAKIQAEEIAKKIKPDIAQARKFGESRDTGGSLPGVDTATNPQVQDTGIGFDQVVAAVKAGKTASRKAWAGSITLLPAADGEGKVVGMNFKTAAGIGRAGLHTNDLLATDWEIN